MTDFFLNTCLVSLLKDLKHANIVTLHDTVHTPNALTLVFEYLVRIFKCFECYEKCVVQGCFPLTKTCENLMCVIIFCSFFARNEI